MYKIDFDTPIHVHFIGIGGISMSALAELLLHRGFTVSGSDRARSDLTKKLEDNGITVYYPQSADNIKEGTGLFVYTAAISDDNPELVAARATGVPVLSRAEFLGQVMDGYPCSIAVAGTHGKTTTTSMLSHILTHAGLDPTVNVGGILKSIGGNIRLGSHNTFLAEACEYTNSFLHFFPLYSIILNIEADHLDFFKDIDDIRHSFAEFASQTGENGALIINGDIENLVDITSNVKAHVITFGKDSNSDYYPKNISYDEKACSSFDVCNKGTLLGRISLHVPGEHNIMNALAAIALARDLDVSIEHISSGLESFFGTDRRFEYKGNTHGFNIIDDYAHHPTEIKATLTAAKRYPHEKLYVTFQPHTYTRTQALLPEFAEALSSADCVVLADIYAARETNTTGISSFDLKTEIEKIGTEVHYLGSFEAIENFLLEKCHKNDLLITMGAGNIYEVGENLLKK